VDRIWIQVFILELVHLNEIAWNTPCSVYLLFLVPPDPCTPYCMTSYSMYPVFRYPLCLYLLIRIRSFFLLLREHGGNCDIKSLTRGLTLWLPVYVKGANISNGDIHFSKADEEIPVSISVIIFHVNDFERAKNLFLLFIVLWGNWDNGRCDNTSNVDQKRSWKNSFEECNFPHESCGASLLAIFDMQLL